MPYEYKHQRRVEFSETDMAGIVHFSNFFRYMESAESAFLRSLGLSVDMKDFQPKMGIPRVHAHCDYKKPLRLDDVMEIHLIVREKRTRSMTYEFRFTKVGDPTGEELARGRVTCVCVAYQPDGKLSAIPIPERLASLLEVAPPELLNS